MNNWYLRVITRTV